MGLKVCEGFGAQGLRCRIMDVRTYGFQAQSFVATFGVLWHRNEEVMPRSSQPYFGQVKAYRARG